MTTSKQEALERIDEAIADIDKIINIREQQIEVRKKITALLQHLMNLEVEENGLNAKLGEIMNDRVVESLEKDDKAKERVTKFKFKLIDLLASSFNYNAQVSTMTDLLEGKEKERDASMVDLTSLITGGVFALARQR